ncbi:unnamed protein product [Prorocentrum cordatum]|uniref:Uncharacterized protein n=1 Tax=Prorocentrum cordatum TaxID=2364126 RepID=A0ABN9VVA9_9DINO|nr:unnamed protein product [Polarella glacialis]
MSSSTSPSRSARSCWRSAMSSWTRPTMPSESATADPEPATPSCSSSSDFPLEVVASVSTSSEPADASSAPLSSNLGVSTPDTDRIPALPRTSAATAGRAGGTCPARLTSRTDPRP